jgi:DNA polymerase I
MHPCDLPAAFAAYEHIFLVDFEFHPDDNGNPMPVCLVVLELRTGRTVRLWRDQLGSSPPYPTSNKALFVAYYASAEIGCHLALGWPVPERILDLFVEFKCATNGRPSLAGNGLIGALAHHGLDGIAVTEKEDMRQLILSGGPWSDAQKAAILDYCASDVVALARLLPAMAPRIDLPRALLRGRYMAAAARIERSGVPLDVDVLRRLMAHWEVIKAI